MEEIVNFEGQNYLMKPVKIYKEIEYYSNFYKVTDYNGKIKIIGDCDYGKQKR